MAERDIDDGLQRFLARAANHRVLSSKEVNDLTRRAHAGDTRARDELIEANIRLVVRVARFYRGRGVPFGDLIQEGVIGLHHAIRKYDPDRGFRFATYAVPWIQQQVRRAVSGSGTTIRIPPQVADRRAKAKAAILKDPDIPLADLAALMEVTVAQLESALDAADVVTSLDREVGGDDESAHTLMDTLADPFAPDPGDGPEHVPALLLALQGLPEIQRKVIVLRFGLSGREALPLADVARVLGMSTTATQREQREALTALRGLLD